MKVEATPRTGAIDALAAGLRLAGRRPWLMIIPAIVDVLLWVMPRLSVEALLMRLLVAWEALVTAIYSPSQLAMMEDMLGLVRDTMAHMGQQINVAMALTGGWLAPTSALAATQANRWLLVSDGVLAPLGLALQLPAAQPLRGADGAIGINSIAGVILVVAGLWLVAQLLATLYLRWAALSLDGVALERADTDKRAAAPAIHTAQTPLRHLFIRLLSLSLLLGAVVLFLRLPLAAVIALAGMSGSGAALLFVISGGITLWLTLSFLVAMFFASDAILLDGEGLLTGIWRSLILTRGSGLRTIGFVVLINLLMLGARGVWGLIGQAPLGGLLAILGNAYLVTGMALASMIYYDALRREWQTAVADKAGK